MFPPPTGPPLSRTTFPLSLSPKKDVSHSLSLPEHPAFPLITFRRPEKQSPLWVFFNSSIKDGFSSCTAFLFSSVTVQLSLQMSESSLRCASWSLNVLTVTSSWIAGRCFYHFVLLFNKSPLSCVFLLIATPPRSSPHSVFFPAFPHPVWPFCLPSLVKLLKGDFDQGFPGTVFIRGSYLSASAWGFKTWYFWNSSDVVYLLTQLWVMYFLEFRGVI